VGEGVSVGDTVTEGTGVGVRVIVDFPHAPDASMTIKAVRIRIIYTLYQRFLMETFPVPEP
jgi:hypothetical protein